MADGMIFFDARLLVTSHPDGIGWFRFTFFRRSLLSPLSPLGFDFDGKRRLFTTVMTVLFSQLT